MRTQLDIDNERRWTAFSGKLLLIVYALMAVGYGYLTLLEMAGGNSSFFAHMIAAVVIFLCLMPGIFLWRYLRPRSKYAALYGLLVAATLCCIAPQLIR